MTSAPIRFAPGLLLPSDAVTQTFAVIAKRGQGKTYTATYLAECMLAAGNQVVAIDPVGVWYGLRLAANGKAKGFDLPVFGGVHGDLPLTPESGRLVAQVIVERGISAVLDVSAMRKGERVRFLADFGEELVHLKKTSRSPIHFFLEEAQTILPQRTMPGQERMAGAWSDVIQIGRNFGLGTTLISQRPQLIDKDVLNQSECLIVGQLAGPQERKAIEAWIVDQGADIKTLVAGLPGLAKHEKWVWSPQWLGVTVKVTIPAKATYDASRTPAAGAARAEPKPLSSDELKQLRTSMAESIAVVEANDPKALRKRIGELEQQLAKKPAAAAVPAVVKVVEKPVLRPGELDRLQTIPATIEALIEKLATVATTVTDGVRLVTASVQPQTTPAAPGVRTVKAAIAVAEKATSRPPVAPFPSGRQELKGSELRILDSLAWWASIGMDAPSMVAAATMADYTMNGHFDTLRSGLRVKGFIEYPSSGVMALTLAGRAVAVAPSMDRSLAGLHGKVLSRLGPERKLLSALLDAYPEQLSVAGLAERSGYTMNGHFDTMRSKLNTLGFANYPTRGFIQASELLFPKGLK